STTAVAAVEQTVEQATNRALSRWAANWSRVAARCWSTNLNRNLLADNSSNTTSYGVRLTNFAALSNLDRFGEALFLVGRAANGLGAALRNHRADLVANFLGAALRYHFAHGVVAGLLTVFANHRASRVVD